MDKAKDERYTPPDLLKAVKRSLGWYWDACPRKAQESTLDVEWFPSVYVNPPGSLIKEFAEKCVHEIKLGNVRRMIWCYYNWDHSTRWWQSLHTLAPTYVLLNKRWKFEGPSGKLWDVGRSQAFGLFGDDYDLTPWTELGTILYHKDWMGSSCHYPEEHKS